MQGVLYTAPKRVSTTQIPNEGVAADMGSEAMRLVEPIGKAISGASSHAAAIAALQDVMCAEMGADGFDAIRAIGYLSQSITMRDLDARRERVGLGAADPDSPETIKHVIHVLGQVMGIMMSQVGLSEATIVAKRRSERRAP